MANMVNLKICFLALTLGQGGAERQLYYTLKVLKEQGASVRLLSLTRGEFWEQPIRELGIPVTWVGQRKSKVLRLARIVTELRKEPPDILQSQHFFTNLYVAAAARLLGLREVGAIRSEGNTGIHAAGKVVSGLSLHAPRVIAANSQAAIKNAATLGVPAFRLQLLPNVVDTEYFRSVPRPVPEPVRLLTVGRLVTVKRFDRFIAVASQLRQQAKAAFKGVIVGNGPERANLQTQAGKLGLSPHIVEFKGSVGDVAPVYRESDIFVITSDSEGTPNVVLEAMASGLPVVATGVGGIVDLIKHGETGYLVEPGDERAMVDLLLRLIENPHLRMEMGQRAREYVIANHSLYHLPVALTALYTAARSSQATLRNGMTIPESRQSWRYY